MDGAARLGSPALRRHPQLLATASVLALALGATTPARAQTAWTGTTSTDWFTLSNWTAGVPAGGVVTTIDTVTPNATIIGAAGAASALNVGFTGTGNLTIQNGGTLTTGAIYIGVGTGSTGRVTVSSGGTVSGSTTTVGSFSSNANSVTVDGAGSTWTNSDYFIVGDFRRGALTITNGGAVSNAAGYIAQQGPSTGTVIVDGAGSSWTNSGILIVGNSGSGTLNIRNGGAVSATDVILGLLGGSGTLNIGAASGQAAAAPGTLTTATVSIGTGSGIIVFNHTGSNYTFAPAISGAAVTVEAGTTILTATNTYGGATTINGGTLTVSGSIANSAVTVNTGGTLGGSGTVGATQINAGGTFAPGNGTANSSINVATSLSFQTASTYMVQVNPATASFANVTGTASLGGATVKANFAAGSYISKQYTIVQATGGVSGTFTPTVVNTNLPTNFHTSLSYDPTHAYLNLTLNFGIPGGLNGNQQRVGNALTNFFTTTGGIPMAFGSLSPAGLSQAAGEAATGGQQTTFNAMTQFLGILTDPLVYTRGGAAGGGATPFAGEVDAAKAYAARGPTRSQSERDAFAAIYRKAPAMAAPFVPSWSVWTAGYGGTQSTNGDTTQGTSSTTSRLGAVAVGADYRFSPNTVAGFALAGGGTGFTLANGQGDGRSDLFQAGAFVRHTVGPAYVSGALAYGWQEVTTNRTVTIAGVDQLQARFNANAYSGRIEGGHRFVAPGMAIGITPYVAGQFTTLDLPAYAERAVAGVNTFALAYGAKSVTASRSEFGLRTDKSFAMQDGIFTLRGRAAWSHDFNIDRAIGATFQTLPGASFVVNGAAQAPDTALVTASAEMKWLNGWSAAATFDGGFSSVTRSYAGKGVARYSW
jgi:T5SS/PEP-CTERM-associated repeat protein